MIPDSALAELRARTRGWQYDGYTRKLFAVHVSSNQVLIFGMLAMEKPRHCETRRRAHTIDAEDETA